MSDIWRVIQLVALKLISCLGYSGGNQPNLIRLGMIWRVPHALG